MPVVNMSHEDPELLLEDILKDTWTGSTGLSLKVLEFYSACRDCSGDFVFSSRNSIDAAHIGMGLVRNVNGILYSTWQENRESIEKESERIRKTMQEQLESSLLHASEVLEDGVSVTTISNSSAVRSALLENREKITRVYLLESRPGLEGQSLAEELENNGIDTFILVDAAVQEAARRSDLALCGSDSVLSDNALVHKVGTYPLFLAMQGLGRKTYSLTFEMKYERGYNSASYPPFRSHRSAEITTRNAKVVNLYFDITPWSLITAYITDRGLVSHESS